MKVLVTGFTFVILTCASSAAIAAPDINWNYVSAGYAKANIKNAASDSFTPDGYQINGSYLLSDTLYVGGSYTDLSGDIQGLTINMSNLNVHLGLRQAATDTVDAFFEAGYTRTDIDADGFAGDTSNGFAAGAGFRYRATPKLELAAAVGYADGSDADSSTFGDLSARVTLTPMIDLYGSYQFDSDVSLVATGVVFKF